MRGARRLGGQSSDGTRDQRQVVHRWRQLTREGAQATVAKPREFVPVAIAAPTPLPVQSCRDIEVELRRGTVTMKVLWPSSAAADFAAWTRELLR